MADSSETEAIQEAKSFEVWCTPAVGGVDAAIDLSGCTERVEAPDRVLQTKHG